MKFEDFKNSFYSRVKDLSLFDAGEINLLKTVLDGLKVDYVKRGPMRVVLFNSFSSINFFFFLQRLRSALKGGSALNSWIATLGKKAASCVLIDPSGRTINNNGPEFSQYFGNIIPAIGRNNAVVVAEGTKRSAADIDFRIGDYNLNAAAELGSLSSKDKKVLAQLRGCYGRVKAAQVFSADELQNIAIAFQQFFIRYRVWNRIVTAGKFKTAILWPHYHREGCIHALREAGVKVIELQHGLIAPQDIFYVLPEQVKSICNRALFADEIWVYGKFWKEQLLKGAGYDDAQIKVKGYFPLSVQPDLNRLEELKVRFRNKKVILVTTQTFLSEYFCNYIRFLSKDMEGSKEYVIAVKLHPAESENDYASIKTLPNVVVVNENLDVLFRIAAVNISIYSTTLFDGLRFNVPGFAIWHERFEDYISFFRDSQVITVIQPDENPLKLAQHNRELDVNNFYAEFNPKEIRL